MLDVDIALPEQALVDLICAHQGVVTEAQLRAAGYTPAQIRQLCRERVLTRVGAGQYRLANELTYFDGLVLLQWAIPEGIIAGLTALSYYELTVVLPGSADVAVPQGWHGTVPASVEPVHLLHLSPALFAYGVLTVYPDVPGPVPVQMYAPAVAVAQVLADPTADREAQEECVPTYLRRFGNQAALEEALARYEVRAIPTPYYAHAGRQH